MAMALASMALAISIAGFAFVAAFARSVAAANAERDELAWRLSKACASVVAQVCDLHETVDDHDSRIGEAKDAADGAREFAEDVSSEVDRFESEFGSRIDDLEGVQ